MRQFMSNLKPPAAPKPAIKKDQPAEECAGCGGPSGVREAGQEDISQNTGSGEEDKTPTQQEPKETVMAGKGPLGSLVTEALNKLMKKSNAGMNTGNESIIENNVQANGQIYRPDELLAKMSRSVGMVPATDDRPTPVNTILDAVSRVDTVDFYVVQSVEPAVNQAAMSQKSILTAPVIDGDMALEGYAVEGVEVVVRLRRTK